MTPEVQPGLVPASPGRQEGPQPLDAILNARALDNHAVVAANPALFLTHKAVQKARRGRRITFHMQGKIVAALNALSPEQVYSREDCFTYRGD